jgi:hypothetical protein
MVRYALAAAARGWHVFPLAAGDKVPLKGFTRWGDHATTDPAAIARFWREHAACNYGIACGPSGLVVVDLDTPKPGEAPPPEWALPGIDDGADVLAALCETHGQPLPYDTLMVRTRRGGLHLYFSAPPDQQPGRELRNSSYRPPVDGRPARGLGWLIDTRAAGGYVVGPGSVVTLPDGAGTYEVLHNQAPAPLPEWLAALLTPPEPPRGPVRDVLAHITPGRVSGYALAALKGETQAVLDSPQHGHNNALNRAAFRLGQLIGSGALPRDLAEDALQSAGQAVHATDSPRQIAATIRSGIDAGTRTPRREPNPA